MSDVRVLTYDDDIMLDITHRQNHSRISLPNLKAGTVPFLRQFGDFYKCNLTRTEFDECAQYTKTQTLNLIKSNIDDNLDELEKARLNFRINLCSVGLHEKWHSPVFAIIYNKELILTTGSNKIYATAIRKQNYNLDFDVFLLNLDNSPLDQRFVNVVQIVSDNELTSELGTKDYVFEIVFNSYEHFLAPVIIDFALHYPITFMNERETDLTVFHMNFFTTHTQNNKLVIEIHDSYDSTITDTSDLFDISVPVVTTKLNSVHDARQLSKVDESCALRIITFKKIKFDLADLLIFFTENVSLYTAQDESYVVLTNVEEPHHEEKISCPSEIL